MLISSLTAGDRAPSELVVGADGLVRVSINGKAAMLRIDPAAPSLPLITRKLAASAGFKMKGRTAGATGYLVGRTLVPVRSQLAKVDLGYGTVRRRVGWTDPPFASVADGSIGPGAMWQTLVRFQLREPIAGEQTVALVMEPDSLWSGALNEFSAVFAIIEVGGKPVRVGFDPHHARTLVTAGAGLRLARQNKGVISGDAVPTEIYFGVRRPVRTLTLQRPFQLGTLTIRTLGIRTTDAGHVAGIEETDTPDSPSDPDDLIVTAKVNKRNVRSDTITLGADYLARCSSIIFDRRTRLIQLKCA